jgi:AraC-like DNA-binding protein
MIPRMPDAAPPADFELLAHSREFADFTSLLRQLTGLNMAINTPDVSRTLCSARPSADNPLCTLIRSRPQGQAACNACDRLHHRRAAAAGKPIRYLCHAGLIDMAIPLFVQGRHVATISCGQVLPAPASATGAAQVRRRLAWLGLPAERLRRAYARAPYLRPEALDGVLGLQTLFAGQLLGSAQRIRDLSARLDRPEIARAKEFIERQLATGGPSLCATAAHAGLSPAHFSHVFHRACGTTFVHHVQSRRVAAAKRLLQGGNRTITDICHACGFGSLAQFNRVFRAFERRTPSAFRALR